MTVPPSPSPVAPTASGEPVLTFSVLTLFPELLRPFANEALLGKAQMKGLVQVNLHDLRQWSGNRHHKVDDTPYGGGAGMVIRVDVVARALDALRQLGPVDEVVMLTPAGGTFRQATAEAWAAQGGHWVILCGRYEGFDARVERLVTREVSIGDFVMMGGEAAAACIMEAVARLVPGVLGAQASHEDDSFSSGLLDYPEYTRPQVWEGAGVPDVLQGGNHGAIAQWRREQALARTYQRRPDLLPAAGLTPQDAAELLRLGASTEQLREWNAPELPQPKPKRARGARRGASPPEAQQD